MLISYLNIAFRNIARQKVYYLIQITGFAIALSCVILILSWVRYELSFDKFHAKGDNIYRVLMEINAKSENAFHLAITPPPMANSLQSNFPEIINSTRFEFCPKVVFKIDDEINFETGGAFADPGFLDMFTFTWVRGNPESAMSDPQSILLTESLVTKYFNQKNPLNRVITIEEVAFVITGIIEDVPYNSHLQFDFLIPFQAKTIFGSDLTDWGNVNIYSYIQLANRSIPNEVDQKIQKWETPRSYDRFYLQPLSEIHGESGIGADEVLVSDKKYIKIFIVISFVILIIATINFINLQSAQILKRTKEVGIRKIVGAQKFQLIQQFIIESSLVLLISMVLSIIFAEAALPYFSQLFNYKIILQFYDASFLLFLTLIFLLVILLTVLIPAIQFASYHPRNLILNLVMKGKKNAISRKILVIIQFSFLVFFIISTLIINQQFSFMKNSNLNNHKNEIIYLSFNVDIGSRYRTFKNSLIALPSIENVTAKDALPTQTANKTGDLIWPGKNQNEDFIIEATGTDFEYFETLGIEIKEGRSFKESISSDNKIAFIINETALRNMGLTDPLGLQISLWGYPGEIIGIAKDVQLQTLKNKTEGQIFFVLPDFTSQQVSEYGVILIQIKGDIATAITQIQEQWSIVNPGIPFEYHFLDEAVDGLYWDEMRLSRLMNYASYLSMVICCLGLLGLSIYNSNARIKEIGIRKINGASILNIMGMLNKDYIQWVLISFVLAFPVAWIVLDKWLQNFAFQVKISWWVFLISGSVTILIALLTINGQILKTAKKNPVDILKYE